MSNPQASSSRRWARRIGLLLVVAGLGYFTTTLIQQLQALPPIRRDLGALVAIGFGVAVPPVTVALIGLLWRALMRDQGVMIGRGAAMRIIAVSQIGKYLPGNVGHFVGRGALARAAGLPLGPTVSTTLLEVVWTLALGAAISALTLLWWLDGSVGGTLAGLNPGIMLLAGAGLALAPWPGIVLLNRFTPSLAARLGGGQPVVLPRPGTAALIGVILLACFGLLGVSVWLQARGLFGVESGSLIGFTLLFITAWVAGYVVPGAPGGLGVREGIMLALFSPVVGPGPALALGVSTRVMTTLGDGLAFLLGLMAQHRHRLWPGAGHRAPPDYPRWRRQRHRAEASSRQQALEKLQQSAEAPRVTLVLTDPTAAGDDLAAMLGSVVDQSYPNWRLLVPDSPAARAALHGEPGRDHRVQRTPADSPPADGDWVIPLDGQTQLAPDALLWLATAAMENPAWALIYTDEDRCDAAGTPVQPRFKPDWSPHLVLSADYPGHLVALRREVVDWPQRPVSPRWLVLQAAGGLPDTAIGHVPRVLCHRPRGLAPAPGSGDGAADDSGEDHRQAAQAFIQQRYPKLNGHLGPGLTPGSQRLHFDTAPGRLASIIIPTRDQRQYLEPCIESLLARTEGVDFEIIVMDNGSSEPDTLEYLAALQARPEPVTVVPADIPFNWSRLNNLGVQAARGDLLVFLNNDTEVRRPDWLAMLAGYAGLPDVGVAGGLLFYPDGTLQHAGVVVGMNGWADHVFMGGAADPTADNNPFVSPLQTRNVLAVTGACLAVERGVYDAVGGFDEAFMICGSDIAFCLAARRHAGHNVLVAEAQLIHYESKTRSPNVPEVDFIESRRAYAPYRVEAIDPCYNPNLSLDRTWPTLNTGAYRPPAPDSGSTSLV